MRCGRPATGITGATRLSVLTPSGIHLGQGPVEMLAEDPLGSGAITAGAALMEQVIEVAG